MKEDCRILVTGSEGQLGSELQLLLGGEALFVGHRELDLTDAVALEAFMRAHHFDYVVNCAAYTAVDRAEEEKMQCSAANVGIPQNLARLAEELGYRIVHISTDYVFDGNSSRPYTEADKPSPLSVYGATKRKGETALLGLAPESVIIRTGWLYSSFGHNFVKTILARLKAGSALNVVCDQVGTPTYAADLALFIVNVIHGHWTPGIFNYSNEGVASWYDFAVAIAEEAGLDAQICPVSTSEYVTAAARPQYSVLDKTKVKATFGISIPHWRVSLRRCMKLIK
ncbi:MAG: dTDP-4-dehydrorhamnose reductase [Muribaculaceae bacterium]|nr:dTDP-4-dehydrorhamnose reductase [Muribaculaceae bacterium]